jgi:hypothetical protein
MIGLLQSGTGSGRGMWRPMYSSGLPLLAPRPASRACEPDTGPREELAPVEETNAVAPLAARVVVALAPERLSRRARGERSTIDRGGLETESDRRTPGL